MKPQHALLLALLIIIAVFGHRYTFIAQGGAALLESCNKVLSNHRSPGPEPNSTAFNNLASFEHQCLTKRPVGSIGTVNMNNYWLNREKHWQTEYSEERLATNMDRVQGNVGELTETAARMPTPEKGHTIDSKFYHNPPDFCRANPNEHPCPNSWIKDAGEFPATLSQQTDKLRNPPPIPALVDGIFRMRPEFSVVDEDFQE